MEAEAQDPPRSVFSQLKGMGKCGQEVERGRVASREFSGIPKVIAREELSEMVTRWSTEDGAEDQSRTDDTRIFSPLLYHLSYLGNQSE
jgi:hypothetical protein